MPPKTATRIDDLRLVPPPSLQLDDAPRKSVNPLTSENESLNLKPRVVPSEAEGPCVPLLQELAGVGSEIVTSFQILPYAPIRATWVAVITEFEWNHHFADIQKRGPFHSFHHRHELKALTREGISGTVVTDVIDLDVGFGWAGRIAETLFIAREMQQTFQYRQKALPKLLTG